MDIPGTTKDIVEQINSLEMTMAAFEAQLAELRSKVQIGHGHNAESKMEGRLCQVEQNMTRLRKGLAEPNGPLLHQLVDSVTGVIGLREAVITKHPIVKYIWALLFALGLAFTIYFTCETAKEYFAEPTATKIKLNASSTNSVSIVFCPVAWFDVDKAHSMGLTTDALIYSLDYHTTPLLADRQNFVKGRSEFFAFYNSRNYTSLLDYYESISLDFGTGYTSSEFHKFTSGVKLTLKRSIYEGKIFKDQGVCYAYKLAVDQTWSNYLTAAAKITDRTKGIVGDASFWWLQLGLDKDLLSSTTPGVHLPASSRTRVLVSFRRYVTLNKTPDAVCNDNDTRNYSSLSCMAKCQNDLFQEALGCRFFRFDSASDQGRPDDYCPIDSKIAKVNMTGNEFRYSLQGEKIRQKVNVDCRSRCPIACDRIVSQITLQWQHVLSNTSEDMKTSGDSYIQISVDSTSMYEGGVVSLEEFSTYSFTDLINNVGGTLGLFIGGTILTLAQLILFFVNYFIENRKRRDKVEPLGKGSV